MEEHEEFPKIRGITRLKYEHTSEGWWARYTRDGVTFGEVFRDNDERYGSKRAAWEAAKKWHEEVREILPPLNRREYAEIKKRSNKSGHTGVYRSFDRRKKGNRYFWAAHWAQEPGKQKHAYFYIDEHGEEKAKQLAIEARKKAIASIDPNWHEGYWDYRRGDGSQEFNTKFDDPFAFEGNEKYELHKLHERNKELREKKLLDFIEKHGHLFCEVCGFDFEREHGEIGKGLIEVHHTVALSEMQHNHKTTLEELICICSNCHFTVHNGDHVNNLRKLRFIFSAKKKKTNK